MSSTRLTALLAVLALGLAGLAPATASTAPPLPRISDLDPARALHAAALDLVRAPGADTADAWRTAALRAAADADESSPPDPGRREWSHVSSAGDVDGDKRVDVLVQREDETLVRSGKDGRVLLRRTGVSLLPVAGAGAVRLLSLDVEFREQQAGLELTVLLAGLDRNGRAVWEHELTGSAQGAGEGPAYAARYDQLPVLMDRDHQVGSGSPSLLLGSLSGVATLGGLTSQLQLKTLSLADGSVASLAPLHGHGNSAPWAFSFGTPDCLVTSEPAAAATRISLQCDGTPTWARPVPLMDPYVVPAGDFDGDDASDLMVTTFGFERPRPDEVLRGTRVLSYADGAQVGSSTLDGLVPLGADVSGDGEPDFFELAFEGMGFAIQGVTLDGEVLYRRSIELRGSGMLEGMLGLDITGDGIGDGYLRATPERGTPVTVVIDGRTGSPIRVPGAGDLLVPGLRPTGADLASATVDKRRLRVTVVSGATARTLLSAVVPGPPGAVSPGSAGAVDVDGNGRRDLVVVSRRDSTRLTTAFDPRGRVLWQQSEKAGPLGQDPEVIVVG
jgi:hypothetical protein